MTLIIEKPTGAKLNLAKDFTWNETVWNPSMISTALWLDAADASTITEISGAVSQWNDKSGNGRNATQSTSSKRPALISAGQAGKSVFRFDGSDDWLDAAYEMPIHNIGLFVAWKLNSGSTLSNKTVIGMRPTSNGRFYVSSLQHWKGGTNISVTDNNDWRISYLSGSSTQVIASINGGNVSTASDTSTATTANVVIGGSAFATEATEPLPSNFCNSDLGEIVIVLGTPSTDTRQRIEGYLAHKWGLTASLPSDHPYKTVGPTP
jgi:hypothetical protein